MALLNKNFLNSLVSIGEEKQVHRHKEFVCHATGFIVGFIAKNSKDITKRRYFLFLVTNRHVFDKKDFVDLRFNTKDGKTKIFRQGLFFPTKEPRWLAHRFTNVDVALLNISPKILEDNNIAYISLPEELFAFSKDFPKIGIETGDGVYVLGFPLGISGKIQNFGCAKWGIISRVDKEIIRENKSFLIDSSIFPGNSGGPVILRPEIASLENTTPVNKPHVVGVVSGYIPYTDYLKSIQTGKTVSSSEENSGLATVVPMEFVREVFKTWRKKQKKIEKPQEVKEKINENHPTNKKN